MKTIIINLDTGTGGKIAKNFLHDITSEKIDPIMTVLGARLFCCFHVS